MDISWKTGKYRRISILIGKIFTIENVEFPSLVGIICAKTSQNYVLKQDVVALTWST